MQTRKGSAVEAVLNTAIGWGINYYANLFVLPLFGFNVTYGQAFWIGVIFTFISLARSYLLRRLFNSIKFGNTEKRA